MTSHGIAAWQKKNTSCFATPCGPDTKIGSQSRNATTLRATIAIVTQGVRLVGLSSRMGIIGRAASRELPEAQQVGEARLDLDLPGQIGGKQRCASVDEID